jgi:energy-converting hydrogenase Eha subunit G
VPSADCHGVELDSLVAVVELLLTRSISKSKQLDITDFHDIHLNLENYFYDGITIHLVCFACPFDGMRICLIWA